jgi:hypothetical protein
VKEIAPLLGELIALVRDYRKGDRNDDVRDQIADRTMLIVAILVNAPEQVTADLVALGHAIAEFSTGRYWPGRLSLTSVKSLDHVLAKSKVARNVWKLPIPHAPAEEWTSHANT